MFSKLNPSSAAAAQATLGIGLVFLLGAFFGTAAGALIATGEVVLQAWNLKPIFALLSVLLYALIGAAAGLPFAGATWLGLRAVRIHPTPSLVLGVLSGVTLQAVLLFTGSRSLVVLTLPASWILGLLIMQVTRAVTVRGIASWTLSLSFSLIIIASFAQEMFRAVPARWIALAVVTTSGGVFAMGATLLLQRSRIATATLALLVAFVLGGTVWAWNHSLRVSTTTAMTASPEQPHVILIILDTLRRDHLGCYGSSAGLTPVLDRLAEESTVYDGAYATAPWTVPSHASMFTGHYVKTHGCDSSQHLWLDDRWLTLPEMLQGERYQTVSLVANVTLELANFRQGFDHHVYLRPSRAQGELRVTNTLKRLGWPDRWVDKGSTEAVIELDDWFKHRRDPTRPMFLFVNLMEPHQPYLPPQPERSRRLPDGCSAREAARLGAEEFDGTEWHARRVEAGRQADIARALYEGEVAYQDRRLGDLLDVLRSRLDLDRTLLMVTSDHGENLGEGRRWGHLFAINDHLIHVPLLIRYPSSFPPGRRVPGFCQLLDIMPTVFDVLGRPIPVTDLPGRTLVPERFVARDAAFAEWAPQHFSLRTIAESLGGQGFTERFNTRLRTVVTDEYQYVWSSDGRHRMYHKSSDPQQKLNLITSEPAVARRLDEQLSRWWTVTANYNPPALPAASPIDEDAFETLKTLGYVGD